VGFPQRSARETVQAGCRAVREAEGGRDERKIRWRERGRTKRVRALDDPDFYAAVRACRGESGSRQEADGGDAAHVGALEDNLFGGPALDVPDYYLGV